MSGQQLLKGKWVLVTGASKGLGANIAITMAKQGGSLALMARSEDKLEDVCHTFLSKQHRQLQSLPAHMRLPYTIGVAFASPDRPAYQLKHQTLPTRCRHFVQRLTPILLHVRLCSTVAAMVNYTPLLSKLSVLQTAKECKNAGAPAVEVYPCDGTSAKGIDDLCKTLLDKHSCMDVVVHSAGIFPMSGQTPLEGVDCCICQPEKPVAFHITVSTPLAL